MKKVLIITHSFPPNAGSGVIRTLKFVKYLPENNWMPVILTVKVKYNEKIDYSMLAEVPKGVEVYRTFIINILDFILKAKNRIRNIFKNKEKVKAHGVDYVSSKTRNKSFVGKMGKFIADLLTLPDKFSGWLIPGVLRGLYIFLRRDISLIYSSTPLATVLLIGLILKLITRKPWIVDFRDPWLYKDNKFLNRIEKQLELMVMKNADMIIANTDYMKNHFMSRHGAIIEKKIKVITNGYDAQDFVNVSQGKVSAGSVLTISHVGEFYENIRRPDNFLVSIGKLLREKRIGESEIKINFVGGGEYVNSKTFCDLLISYQLNGIVNIVPHISHCQSIEYMAASDVLLLLQPSEKVKIQVPAKAFEYIKTGKYILALAPQSATSDLMSNLVNGSVVNPDDINAIAEKVFELFCKFRKNELNSNLDESLINKYDRRELTKDLASIFDALSKNEQLSDNVDSSPNLKGII